jgi:hypothetical protein
MELYSYTYSLPYFIFLGYLLALMLVEFYKISRQQSVGDVRMLTRVSFVLFFGLRGFVCTDWYSYYPYFEQLKTLWSGGLWQTFSAPTYDAGFELYSVLVKSVCPSYFSWVFVSTAIDVALLHVVFKRYVRYYVFAFILFFVFHGEVMELNLMRNVKSILLFFLSLKYLQERKILPYMLLNLLGVSFHLSSLAYLPLYFVLHREFPRWLFWAAFIVGNILFLLQVRYIQPLFTMVGDIVGGQLPRMVKYYFANTAYGISIGYVERVISFTLIMLLLPALKRQGKSNLLFVNLYLIYMVSILYFGEAYSVMLRMSYLFIGAYWFLFPNILQVLRLKSNQLLLVCAFGVYAFIKILLLHPSAEMKYDNLMFGIHSFEERKEVFEKIYRKGKYSPEQQQQ